VIDAVRYDAQENGVATGRSPDGAAGFYRPADQNAGTKNGRRRISDVVINEIMYDPVSGDGDDQYVELYNHTTGASRCRAVEFDGWNQIHHPGRQGHSRRGFIS